MLRCSKCQKTAKIFEKCQIFAIWGLKRAPCRQKMGKNFQNFFSSKCSIKQAEQSPPGFWWVKTILKWWKSPKTEFWYVFAFFSYTSLLKYANFGKKSKNTFTTHFGLFFLGKNDIFPHPYDIRELLRAKLKCAPPPRFFLPLKFMLGAFLGYAWMWPFWAILGNFLIMQKIA